MAIDDSSEVAGAPRYVGVGDDDGDARCGERQERVAEGFDAGIVELGCRLVQEQEPRPQGEHRGEPEAPTLERAKWEHIARVLLDCDGNVSEAARRLGITRMALSPDKNLRGHFHGTSACLSALYRAERYAEIVSAEVRSVEMHPSADKLRVMESPFGGEKFVAFFAVGSVVGPIGGPPAFFLTGIDVHKLKSQSFSKCRFHNCVFDGTRIASLMPCTNFLSAGAIVASAPRNFTRSLSTK